MQNYLAHNGILGQKWGKKNGPPYPLDYSDHSSEEKRKNNKTLLSRYEKNNDKYDFARKALAAVAIAGAAYIYVKNAKQINSVVSSFTKNSIKTIKDSGAIGNGFKFAKSVGLAGKDIAVDAAETAKNFVTSDEFKESVKDFGTDVGKAYEKGKEVLTSDEAKEFYSKIGDAGVSAAKATGKAGKAAVKNVGEAGKEIAEKLSTPEAKEVYKSIGSSTKNAAISVKNALANDETKAAMKEFGKSLGSAGKSLGNAVYTPKMRQTVKTKIDNTKQKVKTKVEDKIAEDIGQITLDYLQGNQTKIDRLKNLYNVGKTVAGGMKSK